MANKKNQHFLPQYFFKKFSSNKRSINLILRKTGKVIKDVSIKGQCSKNNFYGSEEVENLFSKIEGEHSSILRKFLSFKSIHDYKKYIEDYDSTIHNDIKINPDMLRLLQLVLFQKYRTEYEVKKQIKTFSKIHKEIFLSSLEMKEKVETFPYKDEYAITMNETEIVLNLIDKAFKYTPAILDMDIYILKNKTDTEFIFSDSPVVSYNKAYNHIKERGILGLQSPGLLIFFPISPDTCLLFLDKQKYQCNLLENKYFLIRNTFDVDNINKLQLHNSLNAIYFSNNLSEKYIKKIWRQQKNNFSDISEKLHKLYSFEENENTEIIHMYDTNINFELNLSFIKPINLSREIVMPKYRDKDIINIIKHDL